MMEIKIIGLDAKAVSVPLIKTNPEQKWRESWSNQLILLIKTNTKITGVGEVFIHASSQKPYIELVKTLSNLIIGMDPTNINLVIDTLEKMTYASGRSGITSAVIAGIDTALHDIIAKSMNIPLYKLLGGKRRDAVRAYASFSRYNNIKEVIEIVKFALSQGFKDIKLHQGGVSVYEYVKSIRDELGYDFNLMLDLNCSLSLRDALLVLPKLEKYSISWIEEPTWPPENLDILKELSNSTNIPIAAGENFYCPYDYLKLIEIAKVKIIQPDIAKVGLSRIKKIITLAETTGCIVMLHCRPQSLWSTILASIHVGVTMPWENMIEASPTMPYQEPFIENIKFNNGMLSPTDVPGIGIRDEKWFDSFPPIEGNLPKFID
ncbi:putative racemase [Desulfurella amilsii]|uniref:Putative racemase n=1 Tax=Desulfurella amilsii TaxID=1562698 RepID=A0A1X4XUU4_9BACT|nr:mandelate racemase/muconate lactonizing enzyme family protein [Desulfurella amilsii]OSS41307.1 putative racemase [Desulfurella amilsii]